MTALKSILTSLILILLLASCNPQRLAFEYDPSPTPPGPEMTRPATPEVAATVAPVPAVPPEVEQAGHEWVLPHKDFDNTRYTTDASINAGNVHQLGVAWTLPLSGNASKWGTAASNPLIIDGVVYFQSLMSDVYALDLETGAIIWEQKIQQKSFGPNGPAAGWGKIFVQNGERELLALDMETGEVLWVTTMDGPAGAQQPLAYGGFVYTGIPSGAVKEGEGDAMAMDLDAPGTSGFIYGVDQSNGHIVWRFATVTDDFWGNPELNSGAGIWFPPAVDTGTGATFWATGNPAPFPGTKDYPNASSRPGPNLYSNTMLAFDGTNGHMLWYNQVWPRDIYNYDFQNSPVLATARIDGAERDIVIGTGKMGRVYAFDRESGELLWETPVGLHENDELRELPLGEVVRVLPGMWGGIETPVALANGILYVLTLNLPSVYTATAFDAEDGAESVDNIEGRIIYDEGHSELVAIDVDNGEIQWSLELPEIGFGAATVVNDLIFTATYDGVIYAVSRDGEVVWSFQAPGGIVAWPAVAGDSIIWPIGLGREPVLLALRLGAEGSVVQPAGRAIPSPEISTPVPSPTPFQEGTR